MLHHHVPQQIKTLKHSSLQDNFFLLRLASFHKCQVLSFCTCCCAVATSPSNSRAPQRGLKLRRRSCLPTTKKTGAAILNLFWNLAFLGYLQVRALHLGEVCFKKKKSCNLQDRKPGLKKKKKHLTVNPKLTGFWAGLSKWVVSLSIRKSCWYVPRYSQKGPSKIQNHSASEDIYHQLPPFRSEW